MHVTLRHVAQTCGARVCVSCDLIHACARGSAQRVCEVLWGASAHGSGACTYYLLVCSVGNIVLVCCYVTPNGCADVVYCGGNLRTEKFVSPGPSKVPPKLSGFTFLLKPPDRRKICPPRSQMLQNTLC